MTTTMGTPAFMAPEMCSLSSSPYAPFLAEVWALGVCLYMFVFGKGEDGVQQPTAILLNPRSIYSSDQITVP